MDRPSVSTLGLWSAKLVGNDLVYLYHDIPAPDCDKSDLVYLYHGIHAPD